MSVEDGIVTTWYDYDVDGFLTAKEVDIDGDLVVDETTVYEYGARGELISVVLPDATVIEYINGPSGQRIAKKVDGVIVEKYLWGGLTNLLAVLDASGNVMQRFEYAGGRLPVAMFDGTDTYYLHYDQVGSLRAVTDAAGNVVREIVYDSFGNILSSTGTGPEVPIAFAGGLYDADTGLTRFGFRDYDPEVGRWTAKDPIGFSGGDTDLYAYCGNEPIGNVDPTGRYTMHLYDSLLPILAQRSQNPRFPSSSFRIFSKQEVEAFECEARGNIESRNAGSALLWMQDQHRAGGDYDFISRHPSDVFVVDGQFLSSSEFGNYLAGYSAGVYDRWSTPPFKNGLLGVFVVGMVSDAADGGPTYFDNDGSRYYINWGYDAALAGNPPRKDPPWIYTDSSGNEALACP